MNLKNIISMVVLVIFGFFLGISSTTPYLSFFLAIADSNILLSIVTILVGLFAFIIYIWQKNDHKKDAANIIYQEIVNAERILKRAKEDLERKVGYDYALSTLSMPTENWSTYKYMFVRDFSPIEWNAISDFYNKSKLFDDAVRYNSSMFEKNTEQRRVQMADFLADYAKTHQIDMSKISINRPNLPVDDKEEKKWQELVKVNNNFQTMLINGSVFLNYSPMKPVNDATFILNNLDLSISISSIGVKLRRISGERVN